jgi:hypothetical protein
LLAISLKSQRGLAQSNPRSNQLLKLIKYFIARISTMISAILNACCGRPS